MTELTIFKDYDRYIIAPRAQTCLSMTTGLWEAGTLKQAQKLLAEAQAMTPEAIAAELRTFWTDGRFEAACDAGKFGPDWQ